MRADTLPPSRRIQAQLGMHFAVSRMRQADGELENRLNDPLS
jgi:hypothetical protein